jgi:glycopeptide antibiotics resistance protein
MITAFEALFGAVVYFPILIFLNSIVFKDKKKNTAYFLFAFYFASLYSITGLPTLFNCKYDGFVYLIPFVGMAYDVLNSFLNVFLFIPLGFMLPFVCESYKRLKTTLLFGMATSLVIELLQLFTYRKTDVNDLITNTIGTLLGFLAAKKVIEKYKKEGVKGKSTELFVVIGLVFVVMFFVQPPIVALIRKFVV